VSSAAEPAPGRSFEAVLAAAEAVCARGRGEHAGATAAISSALHDLGLNPLVHAMVRGWSRRGRRPRVGASRRGGWMSRGLPSKPRACAGRRRRAERRCAVAARSVGRHGAISVRERDVLLLGCRGLAEPRDRRTASTCRRVRSRSTWNDCSPRPARRTRPAGHLRAAPGRGYVARIRRFTYPERLRRLDAGPHGNLRTIPDLP